MTKQIIKTGVLWGRGATINVELGWVPSLVELYNASDGTLVTKAWLDWVIPFTSGGTVTIAAGATIRGVTSRATATVAEVLLSSTGSFGAGTAAGVLVLQRDSLVGTFGAEDIVVTNLASGVITSAAGGDATVTANVVHNLAIAAAAAAATGTSALSRYEGASASAAKGFTVGSALAVADKILRYVAYREDF